jgi:hypothetical protein
MFPAGVDNPLRASPRSLLDSRGSISEAELCLIQIKRKSVVHTCACAWGGRSGPRDFERLRTRSRSGPRRAEPLAGLILCAPTLRTEAYFSVASDEYENSPAVERAAVT